MSELENDEARDPDEARMLDAGDTAAAFEDEGRGQIVTPLEKPRSLTIRDTEATSFLNPNLYIQIKALASDFIKSKAIPKCWETAEQVVVGLQTGVEMGMKPMEAMNSLYPVNGAINVWGKATTRRITEHGYSIKYMNESQESCTATVSKGREKYTETYTFADAELSGYTTGKNKFTGKIELKVGWVPGINRRKKLRYGVLSLIISGYIPEVLGSAVGIVEVSEDIELGEDAPKQITARDRILAAETKRKKLEAKNFKPKPIQTTIEVPEA